MERNKFLKTVYLLTYAIIFGQRTFFSIIKFVFREKRDFYLLYYNAIFRDHVLLHYTRSSIEIDVTEVKKHVFSKFCWKVCKINVRKRKLMLL